jgi:hypothetical protein
MISAPMIAMLAPTASLPVCCCPSTSHKPDERRGDLNAAVRGVRSSCKGYIDARQCDGKADQAEDAERCDRR